MFFATYKLLEEQDTATYKLLEEQDTEVRGWGGRAATLAVIARSRAAFAQRVRWPPPQEPQAATP